MTATVRNLIALEDILQIIEHQLKRIYMRQFNGRVRWSKVLDNSTSLGSYWSSWANLTGLAIQHACKDLFSCAVCGAFVVCYV